MVWLGCRLFQIPRPLKILIRCISVNNILQKSRTHGLAVMMQTISNDTTIKNIDKMYIYIRNIYLLLSLHQSVSKTQISNINLNWFFLLSLFRKKRGLAALLFQKDSPLFQIATTTKFKTNKFGFWSLGDATKETIICPPRIQIQMLAPGL